jgi:hypothetical protein
VYILYWLELAKLSFSRGNLLVVNDSLGSHIAETYWILKDWLLGVVICHGLPWVSQMQS